MHPTGLLPQRLCASPPLLLVLVRPSVSMSARAEKGRKEDFSPVATILQSDMLPPGDGRVPVFPGPVITQVFFLFFDHAVRLVGS